MIKKNLSKPDLSDLDPMPIDDLEIEALDDAALEGIAGGKPPRSSEGADCCSCWQCSNSPPV